MVKNSPYFSTVCKEALEKLIDQQALFDVVENHPDKDVRQAAVKRLTDFDVLTEIVSGDPAKYTCTWETHHEVHGPDCGGSAGCQCSNDNSYIERHTLDLREVARKRLAELNKSNP